ncbi:MULTISPECIES: MBL fold metallo-hydrolase [unclassified Halanaerobium]|uniref:MBL fold metallo-hydrolase n=1 Tax=unclassified Halanaerobium TaxID=2641197 RepID=UPI000DF3EAE0|nr:MULTISPECIES: MBL fold metallo-hydrolase [unclassified Halanaerobium]RCW41682.1 L-ascorbate metabolism protein UlaG (beta-lactamase superfamily) [Halanaerobium sp. MA284_MarDTE_T2]RCW78382.1 L-ascorbate metabolism protein UlaG (beta-lactamase superfamily) [Halanaerobium sp. DL-01]
MKIKWWGHSCFLIENDGIKILTDPYDDSLPYKKMTDKPDIVTVSHQHFDHNAVDRVDGDFEIVDKKSGFKNDKVSIKAVETYHDDNEGKDRGESLIFIIEFADKTVCHMGDIGHPLNNEDLNKLKTCDVLLIPVGGYYTIDADQAYEITKKIDPEIVIPMHYKTAELDFPITGVEDFTNKFNKEDVQFIDSAEFNLSDVKNKKLVVLDYVK